MLFATLKLYILLFIHQYVKYMIWTFYHSYSARSRGTS
uniref:Uncharacterized protein n=1 Tax=Arundo donax TaxID=35708 RepID=A0A0A8YL67_ARUDO